MGKFVPIGQVKNGHAVITSSRGSFTPIGDVRAGASATPSEPDHGGGGGVLGAVEGVGEGLYSTARHVGGGLYETGKTVGKTYYYDARYGPTSKKATAQRKQLANLEGAVAQGTYESVRHPLRSPADSALTALGLLSGGAGLVARGAEAAKAVRAAEDATKLGKATKAVDAFTSKPKPGTRAFTHDNVTVRVPASRNAAVRAAQRQVIDPLRHHFSDVPVLGSAATVGKQIRRQQMYDKRLADAVGADFVHAAKAAGMLKRNKKTGRVAQDALARQHAMRVVAEGVPITQRLKTHEDYLNRGYTASAQTDAEIAAMKAKNFYQGHNEQLALNKAASRYVKTIRDHDGNLVPTFTRAAHNAGVAKAYSSLTQMAGNREDLLQRIGKLAEESKAGRYSAPGREFFGQGQDFAGGEVRIPTVPRGKVPKSKSDLPQVGNQGVVNGVPRAIASLYKPYLGKAYKAGAIRNDVVKLMHESWQEAQRYYTLIQVTDRLRSAAKTFKSSEHDILMKTDELPGGLPMKEARGIADEAHTDPSKLAELAYKYESVRQQFFPDTVGGASVRAPVGETAPPGYAWVDSRLLGGLNERNPLLGFYGNKTARGVLRVNDAINNATKLSILYLKPAYIAPNLLGNVAMNVVQQGFAAPRNLARAARLNAEADPAVVNKLLHLMGEGLTGSLESEAGVTAKAVNKAAGFYGKLVDVYPRLAAILHEAELEGFKTAEQLKSLVEDAANSAKLHEIAQRANQEIIDYGDLNNFERSIVRRVIFFYPWVKGATKWTVHFVADHPIQAAAVSQIADIGKQAQQQAFPFPLPSWAESLIPVGEKNGYPTTINPSGISVLSTPADVALAISALARKNPAAAQQAAGMLTPAFAFAGDAVHTGVKQAVAKQIEGSPAAAALGLAGPSKTFPAERTNPEKILLYLLGSGITPRETNPAVLQRSGYLERHPRK
jgi:hypothetical protein